MDCFEYRSREFTKDLERLTRKFGVVVWGCGCCGSPGLHDIGGDALHPDAGYGTDGRAELLWLAPGDFQWNNAKHTIIKSETETSIDTSSSARTAEPEFTVAMIEAIYAAWRGAGVDISGGNWRRFVDMLPKSAT